MELCGEFVLREIMGDHVLVPIQTDDSRFSGLITLNETGVFLWRALPGSAGPEELCARLLEEYDVSPEEARRDVEQFLAHLRELGILR